MCIRGLKHTLWEGGVRGAGLIWSPLFHHSAYTSHHLIHITDWLPTLLHVAAAQTDSFRLPRNLDGLDQWNVLSENWKSSQRNEVLLNIDPKVDDAALRVGDMKLVYASQSYTRNCDGWYPTDDLEKSPCKDSMVEYGVAVPYNNELNGGEFPPLKVADVTRKANVTVAGDSYEPDLLHLSLIHI